MVTPREPHTHTTAALRRVGADASEEACVHTDGAGQRAPNCRMTPPSGNDAFIRQAERRNASSSLHHLHASKVMVVTTVTASYEHWLRHLHRNLLLFGLGKALRVCAADNATAILAERLNIEAVSPASLAARRQRFVNASSHLPPVTASDFGLRLQTATSKRTGVGDTFMSTSWRAAVHFKQHCVWSLLERSAAGSALLLIDGDVTLFRDPVPMLLAMTSSTSAPDGKSAARTPAGRRMDGIAWPSGARGAVTTSLLDKAMHQLRQHAHALSRRTGGQPSAAASPAFDLAVMDDTSPMHDSRYLNSGFMLLRNTPATRAFGRAYLSSLQRRRDANDQVVFNDVLNAMNGTVVGGIRGGGKSSGSSSSSGKSGGNVRGASKGGGVGSGGVTSSQGAGQGTLRTLVLDSSQFPCGYYFYEYRHKRPLNASRVVAVHHNWCAQSKKAFPR